MMLRKVTFGHVVSYSTKWQLDFLLELKMIKKNCPVKLKRLNFPFRRMYLRIVNCGDYSEFIIMNSKNYFQNDFIFEISKHLFNFLYAISFSVF